MVLVDTSVWIAVLRNRGGEAERLKRWLAGRIPALSRFSQLELLQGAKDECASIRSPCERLDDRRALRRASPYPTPTEASRADKRRGGLLDSFVTPISVLRADGDRGGAAGDARQGIEEYLETKYLCVGL
jgi:uncharacterized protein with PIN domain